LRILDVGVVCDKLDVRVELLRSLLCDKRFRLLDMLMTEEKLSVEVAEIDCVKIDDVDFAEASQDKVLEQFAANTACADEEDARLRVGLLELAVFPACAPYSPP